MDQKDRVLARERVAPVEKMADALPVLISYVDKECRYRFNNAPYREWFGLSQKALLGKRVRDVVGQKAWLTLKPQIQAALRGERRSFEMSVPYKTKGERHVQVDYIPQFDSSGGVEGFYALIRDISERKGLQKKLRESEVFNRAVLDSLTAHVAVLDREGTIVAVNDAWNRFALENGALDSNRTGVGVNYLSTCSGETERRVHRGLSRVLRACSPHAVFEYEYICAGPQKERWFLMLASPLGLAGGGAVVSHIDITNRKLAEIKLLKQKQILEQVHDAVIVTDLQGRVTSWSPSAKRMFGYTPSEVIGCSITKLLLESSGRGALTLLKRIRAKPQITESRRKDGRTIYTEFRVALLRDSAQRPTGMIICLTDVTARRLTEEALRRSEATLARAQHIARLGSYQQYLTPRERCEWSTETLRLLGRKGPLTVRQFLTKVVHPDDRDRVSQTRRNAIQTGRPYRLEYRIRRPDGAVRWLQCAGYPMKDAEGKVVSISGTLQDITDRKRLEAITGQVAEAEQTRIARDLHDGLGQLLTGTMHLASGLAQRLRGADSALELEASRVLQLLQVAVSQTRQIARGLYPVRAETGGLPSALLELADSTKHLFRVDCRIKLARVPEVLNAGAATHLYRIVQEAIQNAIRHSACRRIKIFLGVRRNSGILSVRDNGRGFAVQRTSGIGLHIMRSRASILGGVLIVTSRRNLGTRIACSFPKSVLTDTAQTTNEKLP